MKYLETCLVEPYFLIQVTIMTSTTLAHTAKLQLIQFLGQMLGGEFEVGSGELPSLPSSVPTLIFAPGWRVEVATTLSWVRASELQTNTQSLLTAINNLVHAPL